MRRLFTILLAGLLTATNAYAEPLNYDYVYFSRVESDVNGQDVDGDVYGGFWEFARTWHVFGSYGEAGFYTPGTGRNETRTLRLGVGGHYLLTDNLLVAPQLVVLDSEVRDPLTGTISDTGYGAQLDVRYQISRMFELSGGVRYAEVFNDSSTTMLAGGLWHATDWLALGAFYQRDSDKDGIELTVRWYY